MPDFVQAWSEFDMDATGYISHTDLVKVLKRIDPPFGLGHHAPLSVVHSLLMKLDLPMTIDGKLEFRATLMALVRHRKGIMPNAPNARVAAMIR